MGELRTIEIVGGGIAGLSLGVALASRGEEVVLYEASSYPRHRLCGEFVNGVSASTLEELGIAGLFEQAREHRGMKWWIGGELVLDGELKKPVQALSRWAMDDWLKCRFVEAGGELREQARVQGEGGAGRVWATGRIYDKDSSWMGLKMHFPDVELESGLEMHVGRGGYVGLTVVEDGRVNLCGLFEKRPGIGGKGRERIVRYLRACGLDELAGRVAGWPGDEKSFCGTSGVRFGKQLERERERLSLGDAERIIPPFTGNGMSMAFEAAEVAVGPLVDWSREERDWAGACDAVRDGLEKRFRKRVAVARWLQGALMDPLGKDLLGSLGRPGWLPVGRLNQVLTSCI